MKTSKIVQIDSYLKPYMRQLKKRQERAVLRELEFTDRRISLKDFANYHLYYGLHKTTTHWIFREKAPNAKQVFIYGDFSYWEKREEYRLQPIGNGDWEIRLPLSFLKHCSLYKLWIVWQEGADERLPSCVTRVVQDEQTHIFSAQVWDPPSPYKWRNTSPPRPKNPLIYEAHIGMSSEKPEISSYLAFKDTVLPRIKKLGYNTIQLMAIQEHPYYGSFGYQVSNFFAPSFRFGTPDELKELIDKAHQLNISVILDIVHSHSVKNVKEGLSHFDGSDSLYFHHGERGTHPVWDSRCFNYGKQETISFLLSNIKYWLQEFHFDGFRFDGITSMCYLNHGIGVDFIDYQQYFDDNVDEDAITYLTLANKLVKEVNEQAFTIAEDVSGMPGMAFPTSEGGIGFDYRMSMGIADFWTKLIKTTNDENWNVGDIYFRLTDKRKEEQTISYAESHDQAMVGDKTIIFRLIDQAMYTSMSIFTPNIVVDRGIAIHKMIRLATISLCQGGYLNFMGNEFGHPEWIDFPREGNNWSYFYARRQWNLLNDDNLKYHLLNDFDKAMIHLFNHANLLSSPPYPIIQHTQDQLLVFIRSTYLFVFNFNPSKSFTDYEIKVPKGNYKIVLDSDSTLFGGYGNLDESIVFHSYIKNDESYIKLYIPCRVTFILNMC